MGRRMHSIESERQLNIFDIPTNGTSSSNILTEEPMMSHPSTLRVHSTNKTTTEKYLEKTLAKVKSEHNKGIPINKNRGLGLIQSIESTDLRAEYYARAAKLLSCSQESDEASVIFLFQTALADAWGSLETYQSDTLYRQEPLGCLISVCNHMIGAGHYDKALEQLDRLRKMRGSEFFDTEYFSLELTYSQVDYLLKNKKFTEAKTLAMPLLKRERDMFEWKQKHKDAHTWRDPTGPTESHTERDVSVHGFRVWCKILIAEAQFMHAFELKELSGLHMESVLDLNEKVKTTLELAVIKRSKGLLEEAKKDINSLLWSCIPSYNSVSTVTSETRKYILAKLIAMDFAKDLNFISVLISWKAQENVEIVSEIVKNLLELNLVDSALEIAKISKEGAKSEAFKLIEIHRARNSSLQSGENYNLAYSEYFTETELKSTIREIMAILSEQCNILGSINLFNLKYESKENSELKTGNYGDMPLLSKFESSPLDGYLFKDLVVLDSVLHNYVSYRQRFSSDDIIAIREVLARFKNDTPDPHRLRLISRIRSLINNRRNRF